MVQTQVMCQRTQLEPCAFHRTSQKCKCLIWPTCAQGILLELPLAGFFLKKLLRRGCDLNDLPSLDADLYRCLL